MDSDSYRVLSRYYDAAYGSKADLHDVPSEADRKDGSIRPWMPQSFDNPLGESVWAK
jgi:hypothetical protein